MIKEYVADNFHIEKSNVDFYSFNTRSSFGKMWQLVVDRTNEIIEKPNDVLAG